MPANTSRGYPYSLPTDPADIPGAIQDLAGAVDVDVEARADSIHPRPTFRLSSTSTVRFTTTVPGSFNNRFLPFEIQDVIVGGAILPLQGSTTRIVPQLPGFWWFHGSMAIPRAGATQMDMIGLTMQTNSQVLARNSTHLAPPLADVNNLLSVSAGSFFNGTTDYVELMGTANPITVGVGQPSMNIIRRYLVGTRMTET